MNFLQHTRGKWDWYWRSEGGETDCGVYADGKSGRPNSVCRAPRFQSKEQWEADARLISKAPEMLDLLEQYLVLSDGAPARAEYKSSLSAKTRALIAYTKGEAK